MIGGLYYLPKVTKPKWEGLIAALRGGHFSVQDYDGVIVKKILNEVGYAILFRGEEIGTITHCSHGYVILSSVSKSGHDSEGFLLGVRKLEEWAASKGFYEFTDFVGWCNCEIHSLDMPLINEDKELYL